MLFLDVLGRFDGICCSNYIFLVMRSFLSLSNGVSLFCFLNSPGVSIVLRWVLFSGVSVITGFIAVACVTSRAVSPITSFPTLGKCSFFYDKPFTG